MEMDDNKRRRNMILYVLIAFVVYLVLSTVLFPNIGHTQQITKTDYSTFVKALDKKSVDKVEYNTDDYTIYYTKKGEDENIAYKTTGVPNDAGFTDRVLESGASLESVVPDKNSGLMTYYLLTLILPMAIFFLIGWWLNRRMKKAMGDDGPSMNFGGGGFGGGGLGKSGARVIASKDVGVTFKDVAGQEEAKESLKEVVDFLEKPQRYEEIGAKLPRGALLVGPPGTGKPCLPRLWPARRACRSLVFLVLSLLRCSLAAAPLRFAICLSRPRKRPRASCLSTRSIPSVRSAMAAALVATTSANRRSTSC